MLLLLTTTTFILHPFSNILNCSRFSIPSYLLSSFSHLSSTLFLYAYRPICFKYAPGFAFTSSRLWGITDLEKYIAFEKESITTLTTEVLFTSFSSVITAASVDASQDLSVIRAFTALSISFGSRRGSSPCILTTISFMLARIDFKASLTRSVPDLHEAGVIIAMPPAASMTFFIFKLSVATYNCFMEPAFLALAYTISIKVLPFIFASIFSGNLVDFNRAGITPIMFMVSP